MVCSLSLSLCPAAPPTLSSSHALCPRAGCIIQRPPNSHLKGRNQVSLKGLRYKPFPFFHGLSFSLFCLSLSWCCLMSHSRAHGEPPPALAPQLSAHLPTDFWLALPTGCLSCAPDRGGGPSQTSPLPGPATPTHGDRQPTGYSTRPAGAASF